MKKKRCVFIIAILCVALIAACSKSPQQSEQPQDNENKETINIKPEELGQYIIQNDFDTIYTQLSKEFQQDISLAQLTSLGKDFNEGVTAYELQSKIPFNDMTEYIWLDEQTNKAIRAFFDHSDVIVGMMLMPLQSYPETDQQFTKMEYQMPITEEWFVGWGGTNELANYHYAIESQRYAYDLLVMKDDSTYNGDPTQNESYYAFGKDVIAPADGTVVAIESNIPDNEPVGVMNEKQLAGNYVVIDHGNGEYSLIAHLKYQSLTVHVGDKVKRGDVIGQCGNSGNSSEAHIHFQVMNAPDLLAGGTKSIRVRFSNQTDPVRGQFVQP